MEKRIKKGYWILALLSLLICLMVAFYPITTISEKEIEQNYKKHKADFLAVENFFRKKHRVNLIEFNSEKSIDILIYKEKGNSYEKIIDESDIAVNDPRVIESLNRINWTQQDLAQLYKLLKTINCRSIKYASSHFGFENVIQLGYRRRLFSLPHVYFIFQDNISKEEIEKKHYSDAKIYYLDNRVAWTYLTFG